MKTNYPRSHTDIRARAKAFVLIALLVAVLYVAWKPLLSFVSRIFVPVGSIVTSAEEGTSSFLDNIGSYFSSRGALTEENRLLREELETARLAIVREEALKKENDELRALLSRESKGERGILAEIILRPPSSPYDTLILDAGADAGVSAGDSVSAEGFVVGEIARADRKSSVVALRSEPGRVFDVVIAEKFSGRAEGRGGGSFYIRAPRDTEIAEGDIVRASVAGTPILGVVAALHRNEKDPFTDVYVRSPLSLRAVRFVEIAK